MSSKTPIQPCHPSRNINSCTCFSTDQLISIAKYLNKKGFDINTNGSKKQLWRRLHSVLKDECRNEWCWPSHPLLKNIEDQQMIRHTFRPKAPKDWVVHAEASKNHPGRFVWLSNFDIDAVLAQYQQVESSKDFRFFKSVPIDFEKIQDPLSKVNIFDLLETGINQFGVVFNLDKHDGPGSHWTSVYCNIRQKCICYFDSYAKIPEIEIQDFIAKICVQALLGFHRNIIDENKSFKITPLYNATRFQWGSSQCGLYSLYMILSMLHSEGTATDFDQFCKRKVDDDTINQLRKILFIDDGKNVKNVNNI